MNSVLAGSPPSHLRGGHRPEKYSKYFFFSDDAQRDEKIDRRREYLEELFLKFGKDFHATHS
jgi:hypothetical protein